MAHILLIDDDSDLRDVLRSALEHSGHQVTEAENGLQGVDLLKADDKAFDLIVTDVIMPGATGADVVKEARICCPAVKLLAISGGGPDMPARWSLKLTEMFDVDAVLYKPFENDEFSELVDSLLGDADPE